MKRRGITLALAMMMGVSCVLTSCGSSTSESTASTSTSTSSTSSSTSSEVTSEEAVRTDLNVVVTTDSTNLDPHATINAMDLKVIRQIYDPLFELNDETGEVENCLADGYVLADDGMSMDITLKEGVTFQNGDPFTAADAAFSLNRAIEATLLQSYVFAFDSAEVVDDTTVRLNLNMLYGNTLRTLTKIFMVSESYTSSAEDILVREPMGTGAYSLVQWDAAQQIVLKANENFFKGAPAIKDVVLKVIPDSTTAFVALETGDVDLYCELTAVDVLQAKENDDLIVYEGQGNSFYHFKINHINVPDVRVRQAISYAANVAAMNTVAYEDTGVLSTLPLMENMLGYTEDVTTYDYDLDAARALLEEAGIEEGELSLSLVYVESTANAKVAQVFQQSLGEIGIKLVLDAVELGTYFTQRSSGDFDLIISVTDVDAAYEAYSTLFHSEGASSYTYYSNPDVDAWLEEAAITVDDEARHELYVNVSKAVTADAVYVPYCFKGANVVFDDNLNGVVFKYNNMYDYADFSW